MILMTFCWENVSASAGPEEGRKRNANFGMSCGCSAWYVRKKWHFGLWLL